MAELLPLRTEGLGQLRSRWEQFARWWLSGLRDVVPASWQNVFAGKAIPQLFLWRDADVVACRLVAHGARFENSYSAAEFGVSSIEHWLGQLGFRRDQVALSVALEQGVFLRRDLRVPDEALYCLPQILQQEIARRTPFQPTEIWHDAQRVADGGDGITALCHWILPRDRAPALVASTGIPIEACDFLAAKTPSGGVLPVIPLRTPVNAEPSHAFRVIRFLTALLLGSVLLGLLVFEWAQAGVAASLETELAEARQAAHGGEGGADQLTRMYTQKSEPGCMAVWDELSRVLPDDTYLSELRISAGRLTISGYSSQAAHLVRIIDASPIFSAATLVSAIVPDASQGRDRFRIAFQLRSSQFAPVSRAVREGGT